NAPDGLVMHWTRPFDVLMLAGTLPGMLVTDFQTSLFWWGVVISPVFAAVTLMFLAWGALTVLPRWGALLMAVLFLAQPGLYAVFQLGRPDHHSLLAALAACVLALMLRWNQTPERMIYPILAGLATALSLWVGTETLLLLLVAVTSFGVMWLFGRADAATALWRFAVFFAAGLVVALMIERPPVDWFAVELDRLSLVYIVLALAMLAAAGLVFGAARITPGSGLVVRFLTGIVAALIPACVMGFSFPAFFEGPYGQVAPEVREVFLANVREAEPLLTADPRTWADAMFTLGPVIFVLPFVLYRLCRGDTVERGTYVILGLALTFYIVGALYQVRVLPYAEIVLVLIWTVVLVAFARFVGRLATLPGRVLIGAAGFVALLLSHIVAAIVMIPADVKANADAGVEECDWRSAGRFLRDADIDGTVLTYIYPGPEIALRTGYGVVAAPYHRMEHGIVDAHRAFLAEPLMAKDMLAARDVGLVILCTAQEGKGGHDWYVREGGTESLYGRLAAGDPPSWAVRLGTDDSRLDGFLVYRVP
ncbi:MAG: hypothetical protein AAF563_17870, partial [Pseudomonadota bacterium]